MPRSTKDLEIKGLAELREIAMRDPMRALPAFVGKVVGRPGEMYNYPEQGERQKEKGK